MRIFTIVIYVFAAIALITGANDFVQGLASMRGLGATLTDAGFADPTVDNVFRFFAGLWFGVGVLFLVLVRDLDRYKPAMIALLSIVALGGIGRVISIIQYGFPNDFLGVAFIGAGLLAELVVSPVLIWWLVFRHQKAT